MCPFSNADIFLQVSESKWSVNDKKILIIMRGQQTVVTRPHTITSLAGLTLNLSHLCVRFVTSFVLFMMKLSSELSDRRLVTLWKTEISVENCCFVWDLISLILFIRITVVLYGFIFICEENRYFEWYYFFIMPELRRRTTDRRFRMKWIL